MAVMATRLPSICGALRMQKRVSFNEVDSKRKDQELVYEITEISCRKFEGDDI